MLKRLALWMTVAAVMLALYMIPLKHGEFRNLDSLEVHTVRVNGVDLGYRTVGEGKPLLLIMGYGGSMDFWEPQMIRFLSHSHQVIMYDNRGVGESSADSRSFSIDLFASDAFALVHELGFKKVDVLGWSMGAIVAAQLAAKHPEEVDKLILYGGACERGPVMAALDRMNAFSADQFQDNFFPAAWVRSHPAAFDNFPKTAAPDAEIVSRQYKALSDWHGSKDLLPSIKSPTLILCGENDWVTPVDQSLKMARLIPGSWLARFKGAGHWLMFQYPIGIAETIDNFLSTDQNLLN